MIQVAQIMYFLFTEPTVIAVGGKVNRSLNAASKVYFETDIPSSGNVTFTLTASKGKV